MRHERAYSRELPDAWGRVGAEPRTGFVDLHCHLLPGIDDGPATLDESIALARALVAEGVTTVVATPHVSRGHQNTAAGIAAVGADLRHALSAEGIPLDVRLGAEVSVDQVIDLDRAEIEALRLDGSGPLLLELPLHDAAGDYIWPARALLLEGVPLLIAHPERIRALQRDDRPLRELISLGAWAQLNASSLLGEHGPQAHAAAFSMLDAGLAHTLATDAHHADRRKPMLRAALLELANQRPAVDRLLLAVHTPRVLVDTPTRPPRAG